MPTSQDTNTTLNLKAILIDCVPPSLSGEESKYRLIEAENLVKTYGGIILIKKIQKKITPNYNTYIGSGKIEELIEDGKKAGANILIVNNELKPHQTYNLAEKFRKSDILVWDRIDLILKIFQKHATSREAKLEIELASIKHMGPRIFGMGMELSRQAGGIGTRGVGETNIEFMRRHLFKMEQSITKQLENCKKVREQHRNRRKRQNFKTVGIIGYTNAGKTSLLNYLTGKGALTANKLFATLDTRVGKLYIPLKNPTSATLSSAVGTGKNPTHNLTMPERTFTPPPLEVLISDTIGFISDLPTTLIKSFRSTLEETIEADLLLHVIDINDPQLEHKIKTVNNILAQIEALYKPTIYIFNKTDLLTPKENLKIQKKLQKKYIINAPCFVSTFNGAGIEILKKMIRKSL